jgi:hypothetical protein
LIKNLSFFSPLFDFFKAKLSSLSAWILSVAEVLHERREISSQGYFFLMPNAVFFLMVCSKASTSTLTFFNSSRDFLIDSFSKV